MKTRSLSHFAYPKYSNTKARNKEGEMVKQAFARATPNSLEDSFVVTNCNRTLPVQFIDKIVKLNKYFAPATSLLRYKI